MLKPKRNETSTKTYCFRLPPYIILYIQRFTKNTFYVEKNPTIVNFPIKSIEFGDFLTDDAKKKYPNGAPYDLIANIVHEGAPTSGTYKLHILHKGKIKIVFRFTIMCKLNSVELLSDILVYVLTFLGSGKWFEMQDLHTSLVLPEILPLSEAYIQIYERRAVK